MDRFAVNESRMLYFHRVVLDQARRSPGLLERAGVQLERLRASKPDVHGVWGEWQQLLDSGIEALEQAVLAPTPRGGLLRANSPLTDALGGDERNALWQRVALQQFVAYFLAASDDLDLTEGEQAEAAGVAVEVVAGWRQAPPLTMTAGTLDACKRVVGLRHALEMLHPEREDRRAWLRAADEALGAKPIDLLAGGDIARLHDHLSAAARPLMRAGDMPSH